MRALSVELPMRLFSEANRRGHWSKAHKQAGDQRATIKLAMQAHANARGFRPVFPLVVTITRFAPRKLDPRDNLPMSAKRCRDGIADWLGVNDRDETLVRYEYAQVISKQHGIRIDVGAVQ